MASAQPASRKRKVEHASDDDKYDSDVIIVKNVQPQRKPLQEVVQNRESKSLPASTKRQRVLDCVLLPSPHPAKSTQRAQLVHTKSYHRSATDRNATAAAATQSKSLEQTLSQSYDVPTTSESSRPRRSIPRRSYVLPGLSDDEFQGSSAQKVLRRPQKKTFRKVVSEPSDFEDDSDADLQSDGASLSEAKSESTDSSASLSDIELSTLNPHKRPSAKKAGSSSKSTKARKAATATNSAYSLLTRPGGPPGLDLTLPPINDIHEMFGDITRKGLGFGFGKTLDHVGGRPLRLGTMCSGTESPLLATHLIQEGVKDQTGREFEVEHLFSAENVPYKQAYIDRNFQPPLIFRDVAEFIDAVGDEVPMATTAYGAREKVPMDIDILIAGTSCKDVSLLNNYQKTLSDDGESGITWRGVYAYCKACRPPIVILENVKSAPWDEMSEDYQKAGYEVVVVLVDTKDYYLPQTRQRGYMICIDRQRARDNNPHGVGTLIKELMENFKRHASSPASSFLMENHQISAQTQSHVDDTKREINWARCKVTQAQYRLTQRLGEARSITHWNEDGTRFPPDYSSRSWHEDQPERVEDTIDVAYRRKALPKNGHYDAQYKTRIWNLSQNVYREQDSTQFGIAPCITPTALLFVSDAGRPMTAEEQLRLQGLPLDKISFTTETPAELQSLAGNAMSTTVVGCALLAALIAGYRALDPGPGPASHHKARALKQQSARTQLITGPTEQTKVMSGSENVDIRPLLPKMSMAMRRCYCEDRVGIATEPIQQCADCGHSTCIACGGNPKHNYDPASELSKARLPPDAIEAELRSKLPLRIKLDPLNEKMIQTLREKAGNGSTDLVSKYFDILKQTAKETFTMASFRRTHCMTLTYKAATGRLELVVDDHRLEWRLYALPSSDLAQSDALRKQLAQPLAISAVSDFLFGNPWRWRIPSTKIAPITIQAHGAKKPTWLARLKLPDFVDDLQWEHFTFVVHDEDATLKKSIEGTYSYRPQCGTANDSLYVKTAPSETAPSPSDAQVYLFLDPDRLGAPNEDSFVFSTDIARLEHDEVRQVIARIRSWRPWNQTQTEVEASLEISEAWTQIPDTGELRPCETSLTIGVPRSIGTSTNMARCDEATALISFDMQAECSSSYMYSSEGSNIALNDDRFYAKYSWVFEELRRHPLFDHWHELEDSHAATQCHTCAPPTPQTRWMLNNKQEVKPYEDPQDATRYERAWKQRPQPIVVEARALRSKVLRISLGVNLRTLAHRAFSRLPSDAEDVYFKWKICAMSGSSSQVTSSTHFKLNNTEGYRPDNSNLRCSIDLFPAQKTSLAWMRSQEAGHGQSCLIEESEEALIPHLGLRVEMRAIGYRRLRAGICADHPGFGKTVTTLALIQSRHLEDDTSSILAQLETRQKVAAASIRRLASAATLIVQPKSLQRQWMGEIRDKLGYTQGVYAVSTIADLAKLSIEEIQRAKIISLDPSLLDSDEYTSRLGAFAGLPSPNGTKGRAFNNWLAAVNVRIPASLDILKSSPMEDLREALTDSYRQFISDENLRASIPSQLLVAKKNGYTASKAASHSHLDSVGTPLLHMFYWDRIVVDEFHQFKPLHLEALRSLKADKLWGLSGTPAMDDAYDIAQTASLLGIRLRTGSDKRGVMKMKNIRKLRQDMTQAELFNTMRQKRSLSVEDRIRDVGQHFLDSFVRRNVETFDQIECEEILVPVHLSLGSRAVYAELHQDGMSKGMRVQRTSNSKSTDRDRRVNRAVGGNTSVEEALSKIAALDATDLQSLIDLREAERDEYLQRLLPAILDAEASEPKVFADWKEAKLELNGIGDLDTITAVRNLYTTANGLEEQQYMPELDDSDSTEDGVVARNSGKKKGLREKTSIVNGLVGNLLVATRSLRYLKNVSVLAHAETIGSTVLCHSPNCAARNKKAKEVAISANCGHMICTKCHSKATSTGTMTCLADDCSAAMRDFNLLGASEIKESIKRAYDSYGAKIAAVVDILRMVEQEDEQAILFVQYEDHLLPVQRALEHYSITATVVRELRHAGKQIEAFRKSAKAPADQKTTVLVLNQSDETAAGFNIQNANHVIFLSPLLRQSQYDYDATMAQAVGRVRRHGQQRKLHIWRIVALNTIDVDILEHRERRVHAVTERDGPSVEPPGVAHDLNVAGENVLERTQLVREDGKFSLRPHSWLVRCGVDNDPEELARIKGRGRVAGWKDYSSQIKWSRTYTENDL